MPWQSWEWKPDLVVIEECARRHCARTSWTPQLTDMVLMSKGPELCRTRKGAPEKARGTEKSKPRPRYDWEIVHSGQQPNTHLNGEMLISCQPKLLPGDMHWEPGSLAFAAERKSEPTERRSSARTARASSLSRERGSLANRNPQLLNDGTNAAAMEEKKNKK